MTEDIREHLIKRMDELKQYDEHELDTLYSEDADAVEGAYYELSRLKALVEIGMIE